MISRMGIMHKRDGMSADDFNKHWHDVHGPIVTRMDGIRRYHQNIVVDDRQLGIGFATRDTLTADGFSELWYDDIHAMNKGMASQAQAAQADMPLFVKDATIVVMLKRVVIPVAADDTRPLIKRFTFLRRKPEVTAERFQWEWMEPHAEMVKKMPHVVGYSQNLILDRIVGGMSVPYEEFPYDGVVEFKFENVDMLEKSFASPEYAVTGAHGKTFIGTMTTFLVKEVPILP